jgi:hypothetical protein
MEAKEDGADCEGTFQRSFLKERVNEGESKGSYDLPATQTW